MRFVLLLVLALGMLATPARAEDPCATMGAAWWSLDPYTLTDARTTRIFNEVYARAGIHQAIYLCEYTKGVYSPHTIQHHVQEGTRPVAVLVPQYFVTAATDDELRGMFAHELGHILLWELPSKEAMLLVGEHPSHLAIELQADLYGARLVGARPVLQGVIAVAKRVLPGLSEKDRILKEDELAQRISALLTLAAAVDKPLGPRDFVPPPRP